jgi:hypothetical protein
MFCDAASHLFDLRIINTLRRLLDQSFTILNAKCSKWHENPIFTWHVSSAVTKVCQQSIYDGNDKRLTFDYATAVFCNAPRY